MSATGKKVPIKDVDFTNEDKKYWDKILKSHNLGMARGYDPDFICYMGSSFDLEYVRVKGDKRKVRPSGHGPDN